MPPSAAHSDMDSLLRVESPSSLDSNNNPPEHVLCSESTRNEGKELLNGLSGSDSPGEEAVGGGERKGRYSLRPRSLLRPQITDDVVEECVLANASGGGDEEELVPASGTSRRSGRRARRQAQPLSRYRRRTANARERERMREINAAFEALRRALPPDQPLPQPQPAEQQQQSGSDKVTKIATLRLAIRYIAELTRALGAVSCAQLPEEPRAQAPALPPVSSLLTLTAGPLRGDDSPLSLPMPLCLTPPPGLDDLCLEPR